MSEAKPFAISKWKVREAYERVKANKGAAGVDGESLAAFETRLKDNLYKIWNRMSSGTYFPPPVRRVEIPKKDGRTRPLGIPTVSDRIAQMVVKLYLEPEVEPRFHPDSYGYRPGKSAHDAVGKARERCFTYRWVIDMDIKGFFDNLDHELVMRAVRRFTSEKWILLYVERWLKAPVRMPDGSWIHPDHPPIKADLSHIAVGLWCGYIFVLFCPGRKGSLELSEKHLMQAYGGMMNIFGILALLLAFSQV